MKMNSFISFIHSSLNKLDHVEIKTAICQCFSISSPPEATSFVESLFSY